MGTPMQRDKGFPPTNWDWVEACRSGSDDHKQQALSMLCSGYWYPVYAYLRGSGHTPEDAEDLTQGFFVRMLRHDSFSRIDRHKGRLRNYLLTSLKHFVFAEHSARVTPKRGNGALHLPLHVAWAETRLGSESLEPSHNATPERLFNQRWLALIMDLAMQRLSADYAARGEAELFSRLAVQLDAGKTEYGSHKILAQELGVSETSVRVGLVRLKKRLAATIREVIAETVGKADSVDAELQEVLGLT
ncbi:MAG: sigma-70 family RNA polymerase sigma factor [Verrucomicrobiaceae bacterium]|nr:sigma-70 family RNA polymerase sigma factor [Verrucomicrobiaceae bacterium]